MLTRVIGAVVVAIVVGLACILLGAIFATLGVPPAAIVGEFLTKWAWVLGILAGLWYFVSGSTWPRRA
jgi:hypothetical protein